MSIIYSKWQYLKRHFSSNSHIVSDQVKVSSEKGKTILSVYESLPHICLSKLLISDSFFFFSRLAGGLSRLQLSEPPLPAARYQILDRSPCLYFSLRRAFKVSNVGPLKQSVDKGKLQYISYHKSGDNFCLFFFSFSFYKIQTLLFRSYSNWNILHSDADLN